MNAEAIIATALVRP